MNNKARKSFSTVQGVIALVVLAGLTFSWVYLACTEFKKGTKSLKRSYACNWYYK